MASRTQFQAWLVLVAGLTLAAPGCAHTSQTNVSAPSGGWLASLKKQFSPTPDYRPVIEETSDREPGAKLFVAYGRLEESRKNLTKAHEAYNTALSKDPESYDAILGLARIEQLAGRSESAEQGFLRAKKIAPDSPEVLVAVGQFYAERQRWDEAIAHHRQAFQLAPVNASYRYELARVLTQAGRVDEGLAHFEKAGLGIAAAHYNVGVILHEQGHFEASEQHLLHATIHAPQMQQAQEWLDVVRRDKARRQAIAAAGSSSPMIQQASAQQPAQAPVNANHSMVPQNMTPSAPMAQGNLRQPVQSLRHKNQAPAATVLGVQPISPAAQQR